MWYDDVKPKTHLRRLLDSFPPKTFIDLAQFDSFHASASILVLTAPTIPEVNIAFREVGQLPFGTLNLITCGGITTGYVLNVPGCKCNVGRNYASAIRRKAFNPEAEKLFLDGGIIILGNDSFLVAVIPTKIWIATA